MMQGGRSFHLIPLVIGTIVMSFYLFPIGFKDLPPSLNTKQIFAVFGLLCFVFQSLKYGFTTHRYTFVSFFLACVFSVCCYASAQINNTEDYTYATYAVSFSVWLAGAYGSCKILKVLSGRIDMDVLTKFVVLACIVQCFLAQMIDNNEELRQFINEWVIQDKTPIRVRRLYGVGMSLDSGGVRLCMSLLLLSFKLADKELYTDSKLTFWLCVVAFFIISVFGNMIARTTTVGVALGLGYIVMKNLYDSLRYVTRGKIIRLFVFTFLIGSGVAILSYLYNTDPKIHDKLRFAFEGFFNYMETGEFRTDSSDVLMDRMWVWPHNSQGWFIGYGLFENLYREYAQTDIGYCRFTMYCGLLGLSIFSLFFIYNASVVAKTIKDARMFAFILLAFTFILWIKVSTDIFQLYALLFCVAFELEKVHSRVRMH